MSFRFFLFLIFHWNLIPSFVEVHGQNLVPNPSFEMKSACPSGPGQLYKTNDWYMMPMHGGSPDYLHACANNVLFSVPQNHAGFEYPYSGQAYAGAVLYYASSGPNYREYFQVKLNATLQAGKEYFVSFKTSLADSSYFASNNYGLYFSDSILTGSDPRIANFLISPHWHSKSFPSKKGWNNNSFIYMASGTENYITVGNFYGFASMNLVVQNTHGQFPNGNISYMYFDDFHIDTCFADINLGKDTSICFGDSLHFDGTTPLAAYRWQNGSTDSTFTAFEAGKYWVEVSSKGCVKSDTIILKSVTKQVDIGKDTIICFGDSFYLNAFTPNASYLWDDSSTLSVRLVNDSATYWVIVFDTMGCNLSDTIRVKLDSCAEIGIDQKKNNKDCATNIYWNEEKLHFQFLEYSEITSLIIYNGKGEKVVDENIFWSRNSEIDISFLSSGLYILVARNDQCTFLKKILAH